MWSRAWNSRFGSPSRLVHLGAAVCVAGEVGAGVPGAVDHALDEGVPGLAVRRDRGDADRAVLVGDVLGLAEDGRSGRASLLDALVDVGHLERDVDDAVAVRGVVRHQGAVGADGAVDDEPDRAGLQHERLVVAVAVLGPGVGDQLHAPGARVVVRGLGGVADHEARSRPSRSPGRRRGPRRTRPARRAGAAARGSGRPSSRQWSGRRRRRQSQSSWRQPCPIGDKVCNSTTNNWTICLLIGT